MTNKELTELKKIYFDRIEREQFQAPDEVWDFFLPYLKSNDEIKREAVEGFDAELMSLAISNIMNEEDAFGNIKKRWNDSTWEILLALQSAFLMYRSLTQKENNE